MRKPNERGEVTTEVVLVVPVLILVVFTVIQFGLWYHASAIVRSAAQEGAQSARVQGGTAAIGESTTRSFLTQAAGSTVSNASVEGSRTAEVAEVRVRGTVASVVPYLHLTVSGHASAPVERFRAPA
jgi:Flp pilus assembly protein TadG